MEILPREKYDATRRGLLVVTFILELLVLIFLSVIGYYMRATNAFPIRKQPIDCFDPDISRTRHDGSKTMYLFAYAAEVPYVAIVVISFFLPPVVITVCELARCNLTCIEKLTISTYCLVCNISTTVRRILRFIGTFLMGILVTMIFTDIAKFMIGRPRPIFLDICQLNLTACGSASNSSLHTEEEVCQEKDPMQLRWARQSFPSFHASITAFAACYLAIYWQNVVGHGLHCSILGPFFSLSFIIMSVLCCFARYSLYYSHWTDVMVGFGLGIILAVYLGVFTLNNFMERTEVFGRNLHHLLPSYKNNWNAETVKTPWYWAPWHWTIQDYVDQKATDNDREPHFNHRPAINDVTRRHTSRDRNITETMYY